MLILTLVLVRGEAAVRLIEEATKRLPTGDRAHRRLPTSYDKVMSSLSSFALGARKLNKYGVDYNIVL